MEIRPQVGPQEKFISCPADIAIYGGSAGGGKTYALCLDPLRYVHNPHFGGVIFRRTQPQIVQEGGIWDTSETIYPLFGARGLRHRLEWRFPSGAKIKFSHMEHDKNRLSWQGSQIPWMGWEELTHFSEKQFWYLFSRNRSPYGLPTHIRGTCNPDPDSFVANLISWWIDPKTGYAIPNRSGVIRYFARVGDDIVFADTRRELIEQFGADCDPKSLTFIRSSVFDNKILLQNDPRYLATLKSMPLVDREQLLKGNWLIRPAAGLYFKREYFRVVDAAPADVSWRVRFWDRAATPKQHGNDPDATAGVRMSKDQRGVYYIEDVRRMFKSGHDVDTAIKNTAAQDGTGVRIGYNQDPGSAGKKEAEDTAKMLAGYVIKFWTTTGDKVTRAKPVSSQAEAGNVCIVKGAWNEDYLRELENFPEGRYDDQVDGTSGAFELGNEGRDIFVA